MQKCEQLLTHESELEEKDQEITQLRVKLEELTGELNSTRFAHKEDKTESRVALRSVA